MLEFIINLVEGAILIGLFGLAVVFFYIKDIKTFLKLSVINILYCLFLIKQNEILNYIAKLLIEKIKGAKDEREQ